MTHDKSFAHADAPCRKEDRGDRARVRVSKAQAFRDCTQDAEREFLMLRTIHRILFLTTEILAEKSREEINQ